MTRTSWLLLGLALLLLAQPVAGPAGAENDKLRVPLEFTDAPLGQTLQVLFHDRPYSFALDPGLEDLRVTISLSDVTFSQALHAILRSHDLTYITLGDVYHVMWRGSMWLTSDPSYVDQFPYGPIIIYARVLPIEEATEIVWRRFSSSSALGLSEERVLYRSERSATMLPIESGFLPAPDGSCLLVWQREGMRAGPHGGYTTRWLAIRLLDGAVTELGETPGLPWLSALSPLPYWDRWDDRRRLVLIPGSCVFTPFTSGLGTLSGALPGPETPIPEPSARGPGGDARDRLTAYCEQHHQAEMAHLRAAFAKLAKEMEAGYLGRDDPAGSPYLLLTSLGIPTGLASARGGWSIPTRHAACSPDGGLIAHADRWVHEGLSYPEGQAPADYGLGARLDVFDVATGQRFWYARRASVPRWIPEIYRTARDRPGWTYPRFADLRWSRDGRYLSFTTVESLYQGSRAACSVTVLDVARQYPVVLHLPNAHNAFVITPPLAETAEHP